MVWCYVDLKYYKFKVCRMHSYEEKLARVYHGIILDLELEKIDPNAFNRKQNEAYVVQNSEYSLSKDEVIDYIAKKFGESLQQAQKIFDDLLNRGFLVTLYDKFVTKNTSIKFKDVIGYRTLHMDLLVRSAHIRTYYYYPEYVMSPRFFIYKFNVPSREDRIIIPRRDSSIADERNLYFALLKFFNGNERVVKIFIRILRQYFLSLGTKGLDKFQAYSLAKLIENSYKASVITAPTGSGKTEIFLIYALTEAIKTNILEGNDYKYVFVYPRKVLAVDQANRFIRILYATNYILMQEGYKKILSFGLRDGLTPRDSLEIKQKNIREFRGIKCPECGKPLIYRIQGKDARISCSNDSCRFNELNKFIIATKRAMGNTPPDFIVTNPWALETRFLDGSSDDINSKTLSRAKLIIVDETHEYTGISGGLIGALLSTIREHARTFNGIETKVILSSATMPGAKIFASKFLGVPEYQIIETDFESFRQKSGWIPLGERLMIVALFHMNPRYSWSTYAQLWAVMIAFLGFSYRIANKKFIPQAIIFINNIRELRKTFVGFQENISLGEPRDHIFGPSASPDSCTISSMDPYMYWHYIPEKKFHSEIIAKYKASGKLDDLKELAGKIYSKVEQEERLRVIESLKKPQEEKINVVFGTSSLELGVDYDNVSFILNIGIENPLILAQRLGRGGRSLRCLRTVLGIILTRNIPSEAFTLYDIDLYEKLNPCPDTSRLQPKPVATGNPQILKRALLTKTISTLAYHGKHTYSSRRAIKSKSQLKRFIKLILDNLK